MPLRAAKSCLADIVAARNAALRLVGFEALAGLFLLVRREDRLTAELAGDLLAEYLSAPSRLQLLDLAALVLGAGRNASIAVNHDLFCIRNLDRKSSIFSSLRV